jgi:hypothetical protein
MASKRPAQGSDGKRKRRRAEIGTPNLDAAQQSRGERSFVDVDPWAMLLEQLMEVPDETEEGRPKAPKRK